MPLHLKVASDQILHSYASSAGSSGALWEISACLGTTQLSAAALNYMVVTVGRGTEGRGAGGGMKSAWEPRPTAGHTRARRRVHTLMRERVTQEKERKRDGGLGVSVGLFSSLSLSCRVRTRPPASKRAGTLPGS